MKLCHNYLQIDMKQDSSPDTWKKPDHLLDAFVVDVKCLDPSLYFRTEIADSVIMLDTVKDRAL